MISCNKKNSNARIEGSDNPLSAQTHEDKGCETFPMTGDMIINTNPSVTEKLLRQDPEVKTMKESHVSRLGHQFHERSKTNKPPQQGAALSPKFRSEILGPAKNHNPEQEDSSSFHLKHSQHSQDFYRLLDSEAEMGDFPLIQAPVAEMEELSDLSESSGSESELGLENDFTAQSQCLPVDHHQPDIPQAPANSDALKLEQTRDSSGRLPENNSGGYSDTSFSEPPSSGDSGFIYDGHMSDPDLVDRGLSSDDTLSRGENYISDETLTEKGLIVPDNVHPHAGHFSARQAETMCQSAGVSCGSEKLTPLVGSVERVLVRTSKSYENYLQAGIGTAVVNIDIDDSLAYSLDTLTYHDSPNSSKDIVAAEPLQVSRSLDNSPEKNSEKFSVLDHEFIPGFISSYEDSKSVKLKSNKEVGDNEIQSGDELNSSKKFNADVSSILSSSSFTFKSSSQDNGEKNSEDLPGLVLDSSACDASQFSMLSDDMDDNLYHQPCKAVDKPSAERLAKRLFNLEGFRKSDVSRHLCKKNEFSNLVAEEYLKFYDFQEDTLDMALRKFLLRFSLSGETQERERVLAHFSHRFMECNPGSFNSEDACHTLTCAIMLLNSDLHSSNIGRRMACQEFVDNLTELNDGEDFSKEVLKAIYQGIKNEPIQWAQDEVSPDQESAHHAEQSGQVQISVPQILGGNPFLEVPDSSKTTEYKKGYVMRKCCMEPNRRKTPLGKRGWKMLYAVLQDMILYQYKDEHQLKKGHFVGSTHSAIRIHHALATKATDYTKKQHVFRLQTADWAEYLFQTGDSKELQEWVDTINVVAATLSAPALPGAVGSKTKFQRQLLPSSYTRLNLREQLHSHESRVAELEQELHSHHAAAPEKGTRSSIIQEYLDKENYLEFETKRFRTYAYLLQSKLLASSGLEPSLVETTIGEYEEMKSGPPYPFPGHLVVAVNTPKSGSSAGAPLQRSMSDRYSYRAAIYQTGHIEYDMV